jgi:hypothetical protein
MQGMKDTLQSRNNQHGLSALRLLQGDGLRPRRPAGSGSFPAIQQQI